MNDCKCKICERTRKTILIADYGSEDEKADYIMELYDLLCCTEADLDYEKAIVDGSWPTADEVIKFRRKLLSEHI